MNQYVTDTHALYWYLIDSPRLGSQADQAFDEADQGVAEIVVPAVVLAELFYMNEKQGRLLDFAQTVQHLQSASQFMMLPFQPEDSLDFEVDRAVPEMHDRIIAGVARRLGAPLLTRDVQIVNSGVATTLW